MSGGNPETMTLRRFIDVGFAVLVQEYQRLGVDLLSAIDKVGALGSDPEDVVEVEEEAEAEQTAIQNQRSMEQLMASLAGVKGAPV